MQKWKILQEKIENATHEIWLEENDELKKTHLGLLPHKPGTYNQYFSTIDHANGMIRDFANIMYQILVSFRNPDFDLKAAKILCKNVHPGYIDYLRYSGYVTWGSFDKEFLSLLDEIDNKDDLIELYGTYLKYINKLTAWAYHYFPWELGVFFPYRERSKEFINELSSLSKDL